MTRVLALIPARGGSKSIPRKNERSFLGHPLLAWSIAAARDASAVDRVMVSTDDPALRATALAHGAEAPFLRPAALAADDTPDFPVVHHAMAWLASEEGYQPDLVVQVRPTSPVRPRGLIDEAIAALHAAPHADSLRVVTPSGENPYKMWRMADGRLVPLVPHEGREAWNMPRQALPPTWWQTGHLDVIRRRTIEQGSLTGHCIIPLEVERRFAVDIDTPDDWAHAEVVARRLADVIVRPRPPRAQLVDVQLVVLDFDGVMTDNTVWVGPDGVETVRCSRADGLGLAMLRQAGIPVVVLSTETHPVVTARCRKLDIPCQQGLADKGAALRDLATARGVSLDHVLFVGNDSNDAACLAMAGLAVVPADAHPAVLPHADWILAHPGGAGAVRELCDTLLEARQ
ncbi:MAG: acylneuraminate cytidylyltransferase [Gemmatimonadetes bacterium]|nr:acylneuraminate cytidylyltransferase [Gemmatimonadota bacterium]